MEKFIQKDKKTDNHKKTPKAVIALCWRAANATADLVVNSCFFICRFSVKNFQPLFFLLFFLKINNQVRDPKAKTKKFEEATVNSAERREVIKQQVTRPEY